jgi:hypothetical protein
MSSIKEWLGIRLCKRLDWAPGAATEVSRAALRALVMAALWTVLVFIVVDWLILSRQGFDTSLVGIHVLALAVGGLLALLVIGLVLLNILMMLPVTWLVPKGQLQKWVVAVGLAVLTTGITHVSIWATPGITVHEFLPLVVMVPHLLGGLVGWGLIQELVEIGGEE